MCLGREVSQSFVAHYFNRPFHYSSGDLNYVSLHLSMASLSVVRTSGDAKASKMITIAAAHHYRGPRRIGGRPDGHPSYLYKHRQPLLELQSSYTRLEYRVTLELPAAGLPSRPLSSLETRHAATTTFVERRIALPSCFDGEQWATTCVGGREQESGSHNSWDQLDGLWSVNHHGRLEIDNPDMDNAEPGLG